MTNKLIGYVLIAVGILLILISALHIFNIFSKNTRPVEVFSFSGIEFPIDKITGIKSQSNNPPMLELLSQDKLNDPLNLFANIIIMGFFSTIGYKIAGIGAMLVRPVKINMINKKLKDVNKDGGD